jgi:hypothetical protein
MLSSFVLTMLHPGQDFALGSTIPFQFIRDDHARHVEQPFEQRGAKNRLAACLLRRLCDPHIEHIAILLDRPPEDMFLATYGEYDPRPRCHLSPQRGRRRRNSLV